LPGTFFKSSALFLFPPQRILFLRFFIAPIQQRKTPLSKFSWVGRLFRGGLYEFKPLPLFLRCLVFFKIDLLPGGTSPNSPKGKGFVPLRATPIFHFPCLRPEKLVFPLIHAAPTIGLFHVVGSAVGLGLGRLLFFVRCGLSRTDNNHFCLVPPASFLRACLRDS